MKLQIAKKKKEPPKMACRFNKWTISFSYRTNLIFFPTDAYSTEDIIYEWTSDEVAVGNKEMAQFEYKGAKLTSATDVFTVGKSMRYVVVMLQLLLWVLFLL